LLLFHGGHFCTKECFWRIALPTLKRELSHACVTFEGPSVRQVAGSSHTHGHHLQRVQREDGGEGPGLGQSSLAVDGQGHVGGGRGQGDVVPGSVRHVGSHDDWFARGHGELHGALLQLWKIVDTNEYSYNYVYILFIYRL